MKTFYISIAIVLLDQISKQFAIQYLESPWWLFFEKIGLRLTFNDGLAFSLPIFGLWAVFLSLIVIVGLLLWRVKYGIPGRINGIAFGLVFGGAISNVLDRIFRGSVVDFIHIFWWPTFNLADSAITIGFLLLIIFSNRIYPAFLNFE